MDPETQREFDEQLRQLIETLSQTNSTMAGVVKSMQAQTAAISGSTTSVKNQTQANAQLFTSTTNQTKLAEANAQANDKVNKSLTSLKDATNETWGALKGFGRALTSTEEGFKKYGSAVEGVGSAAFEVGKNFGILGTVLGGAIKGLTFFASQALAMHDTMIQMNRDLTKFSGVIPTTNAAMAKLASDAGYSGDRMLQLSKITETVGSNIIALGNTAGQGVIKFTKMAAVGDDVYETYSKLGIAQEDLTKMQAMYVKSQAQSGRAYDLQTKTAAQLQKESLAYVDNLIRMSAITGENADELERNREIVRSEFEERVKVRQEELEAQRLEKLGRKDEAEAIRNESKTRQAILQRLTDQQGKEVASMYGRVLRTGAFDSLSSGLAAQGQSAAELQEILKGAKTEQERDAAARKVSQGYLDGLNNTVVNLGDAMQFSGEELAKSFAVTNEALGKNETSIGKSILQREADADQTTKDKKSQQDKDAQLRADQETADRKFQKEWQEAMLETARMIMPAITEATKVAAEALKFMNDKLFGATGWLTVFIEKIKEAVTWLGNVITYFGGLSNVLMVLAGATGIGFVIKMFGGLGNTVKGITTVFGGLKTALSGAIDWLKGLIGGKGGGGPTLGADGKWRDEKGRFTTAPPVKGGKLARFAKGALGGLGGLVGGLLLDYGAEKAEEAGYKKTAAGMNVGSSALTGAGMGAIFGPAGAAVGGLLGGAYGLYQNWDKLTGDSGSTDPTKLTKEEKLKIKETEQSNVKTESATAEKNVKTTERTEKVSLDNQKSIGHFGSMVSIFGRLIEAYAKCVQAFAISVGAFATVVGDLKTAIANMGGGGPGSFTGKANDPASVDAVMAMNYEKESGGGKLLRVKGLQNAGGVGGAYGLSQAARESAFKSMSASERQEFMSKTGFDRAPTLDELVSKDGRSFMGDKAKLADQLLARKFTETTISTLGKRLGRTPTMADVRGTHWHGEAGYIALLEAAKKNPNLTMSEFYDQNPSWTRPDMKQFSDKGKIRTVSEQLAKIAEQAGGGYSTGSYGSGDIVALGKQLQSEGYRVSGHSEFGGQEPGKHSTNSRHYKDLAIDVNVGSGVTEASDPVHGQKFDQLADRLRAAGYSVLWRTKDHYDHLHASVGPQEGVQAAKGGIFAGSKAGYPATLHGTEIVAPITMNSILMKLAKTSANSPEAAALNMAAMGKNDGSMEQMITMHRDLIDVISKKLDSVIDALDDGNSTRTKILRHNLA